MSSEASTALMNAAMIGHEWPSDARCSMLHRAEDVGLAARIMATLESDVAFHWNEGTAPDWETACADIARLLGRYDHSQIDAMDILTIVCDAMRVDCDEVIL